MGDINGGIPCGSVASLFPTAEYGARQGILCFCVYKKDDIQDVNYGEWYEKKSAESGSNFCLSSGKLRFIPTTCCTSHYWGIMISSFLF